MRGGRRRAAHRAYDRRQRDEEFALAWADALEEGTDRLEDEARRRAVDGVDEPITWQGQVTGTVRTYSDTLLMFLLKARRPERFRDHVQVSARVETIDRRQTERLQAAAAKDPEAFARIARLLAETEPEDGLGDSA